MGRVFFNTRKNVHNLTVAYTVLESDSGKVFMVDSAAGAYEITMPTTVANLEGFHCKFITKEDTPTGDVTIAFGSAIVDGWSDDATADIGVGTAKSNILLRATCTQGDYVNIFTDGSTYYAEAISGIDDAIDFS